MKTAPRPPVVIAVALSALIAMAAIPGALAEDTQVNVDNTAPAVATVSLPGSTISPTSGGATTVSVTISVTDLNGYNDIQSVAVTVLKPDGSTVHVAEAAATFSTGTGTEATYTYSFDMNYYDSAALSTSTYKVKAVATDAAGATGDNLADLAVFNYAELAALNLASSSVDFGASLSPNSTSATTSLTVANHGNVRIDTQLSGTTLSHSTEAATIAASNVAYSTASDMTGSSALSGTATTLTTFDLAAGSGSSAPLYWQLTVPSGDDQWVPSGTYTGTLTVSAIKG